MIPAELGSETTTSSERRVFEALASIDAGGVALHSLNLPTHSYKLTSEIDFVVVVPELILAVEVKGAQVSCADGVWTYQDRSGHFRQDREGPFKQASSGMYALRDRLTELMGHEMDQVAFGFLVITPDVDLPTRSFEWDNETYCGRGEFSRGLEAPLRQAISYWSSRQPDKRLMPKGLRDRVVQKLRPSFDRSPLLAALASSLDSAYLRLTDEQFARLDLISGAPRVICSGGAGTGKTFLAAEVARREALRGNSVLLTCRSGLLAAFVSSLLEQTPVVVAAFPDLPRDRKFDLLVVDEAQDLMNFAIVEVLESCLTAGWDESRWVMFMDQNRQAHLYGDFDDEALQFITSFGPVQATLRMNCRNTREIAFQTRAVTGADTGVAAAGSGPEVTFVQVEDLASETAALESHLRSLREADVSDGDVTIVSLRGDWETSAARGLRAARKSQLRKLDPENASDWPCNHLTWASAADFKGLENRFVCAIDIDNLISETDLDRLYVAMSRPRAGLWLAANPRVSERMAQLYRENATSALEALRKAAT